jgi:hypothetical protein
MTAMPTNLRSADLPPTRVARGNPAGHAAASGSDPAEAVYLSTGVAAKMLAVSVRTVGNWVDRGLLKGGRIPGSKHRRVLARNLFDFLEASHAFIPESLRAMCVVRSEIVLYRCPLSVQTVAVGITDADLTVVESAWELAKFFSRPHKDGVIVCGDGAARSEIEDVFRHRPAGWLRIHVRGPDQEPAAGADVALPGDDLGGLLPAVARHLIGGR